MFNIIKAVIRIPRDSKGKPVGMNIPVDPPRFSRAENSRAGEGDIHTNSIELKERLTFHHHKNTDSLQ